MLEGYRFRGEATEFRLPDAVLVMFSRCHLLLVALFLACGSSGCAMLHSGDQVDEESLFRATGISDQYQAVANARERNAVVLQVVGSKEPSRIIPLPSDGTNVYVSMLLKQSGVSEELGNLEATLHRNSTDIMSGVKMGVRFLPKSDVVVPECDYVLQPGDRLEVREKKLSPLDAMTSMFSQGGRRRPMVVQ